LDNFNSECSENSVVLNIDVRPLNVAAMRKLFLAILFVLFFVADTYAQSMLKVRVSDGRRINVWLDGRYFNKQGTSVTVGDLPAGRHILRIYSLTMTRSGRSRDEVIYQGMIKTFRGKITMVNYDPVSEDIDIRAEETDGRAPVQDQVAGVQKGEVENNSQTVQDDQSGRPVASPVAVEELSTLNDGKIDKLKTKVSAKKADTEKMNLLKEGLTEETLTTKQVSLFMDWLGFESSKVEFAEWAYPKTVDKESYSDLLSKLKYKNYQDELEKFLAAQN
jgi:Domain of unknown function (DUF4476)